MRPRIAVPELARRALALAVEARGGPRKIAAEIGISSQAISQWAYVPAQRVLDVERVSGVSRHMLRPDLYPVPVSEQPESLRA